MADIGDSARRMADRYRELALESARDAHTAGVVGSKDCAACGAVIPEARRKAQPNAVFCVRCKDLADKGLL